MAEAKTPELRILSPWFWGLQKRPHGQKRRRGLRCKYTEIPELETDCELAWCKIQSKGQRDIYVGSFYRPPGNDPVPLEQLEASLSHLANTNSIIILGGDFNLPHVNWETHEVTPGAPNPRLHDKLVSILEDSGLHQSNQTATRKENILDLLITNVPNLVNRTEILPGLSDHDAVFGEIDVYPSYKPTTKPKIRNYNKMNKQAFTEFLNNYKMDFEKEKTLKDANELWNDFKNALNTGAERYIPTRTPKKHDKLPWINRKIKTLIK